MKHVWDEIFTAVAPDDQTAYFIDINAARHVEDFFIDSVDESCTDMCYAEISAVIRGQ